MIKKRLTAAFLSLCLCSLPLALEAEEPLPRSFPKTGFLGIPGVEDPHTDDLPGILERGTLRILTTCSRTNFYFLDGQGHGFEFRLLKEFVDYLSTGHPSGQVRLIAQFIPLPPQDLVPALLDGRGDLVAADLHIARGCRTGASYTEPYLTGVNQVLISHVSQTGLDRAEDLSGRTVHVAGSTGCQAALARFSRSLVQKGLEPVDIRQVDPSLTIEDVLELVSAGVYQLTVADSHIAGPWAKVSDSLRLHERITFAEDVAIGLLVRENNDKLKGSLNDFLLKHKKGTRMGNIYFRRYVQQSPTFGRSLNDEGLWSFAGHADLFKEYGRRYGIDWLLIGAVAYQESRLNHNSLSEKGAYGIMQVMPVLAKEQRIGIKDLRALENNIHAGVKYLHLLMTQYFQDSGISERDRLLFALAAYNAGPKAVQRARKEADRRGLNQDEWFNQVELCILDMIGRETVNYVRQVNKRYVSYALALQTLEARQKVKQRILQGLETAQAE